MENLNLKNVIVKRLQDIFSDIKWANHLVEEGKEVPADRKLQGIRKKMLSLMEMVHKEIPEDLVLQIENQQNVASTTDEN